MIENNLHYFKDPMNVGDLKNLAEIQRQVADHYIEKYRYTHYYIEKYRYTHYYIEKYRYTHHYIEKYRYTTTT